MRFEQIIGQGEVKKQLADLVTQNRLSHALLFLGKEGSGALQLALALAQFINCERQGNRTQNQKHLFETPPVKEKDTGNLTDSCGICASCRKSELLIHPDIHYSYPVIPKKPSTPPVSTDYITEWREFIQKNPYGNVYDWLQFIGAENKQGNITAEECKDIFRKLSLKSFESEYKVLVMWMPEYLGKEGNKLLKLIEEPPAGTLFILVAENESLILPTILSRCQLIRIPSLERTAVEQALVEKFKASEAGAAQVAATSEGNFREALSQFQQTEEDWEGLLRDWLNAILKTGPAAQTKWVEEISRLGREKQKQFLLYFNHLLEQAIRIQVMGESNLVLAENERDFALRLNKIAAIHQQEAMIEELDKAAYYIERNANAKILFHALTIKLYHIIQDKIVFLPA